MLSVVLLDAAVADNGVFQGRTFLLKEDGASAVMALLKRMDPRGSYGSMSLVYGMPNHRANADFPGRQFGAVGP